MRRESGFHSVMGWYVATLLVGVATGYWARGGGETAWMIFVHSTAAVSLAGAVKTICAPGRVWERFLLSVPLFLVAIPLTIVGIGMALSGRL
ncbi:MAG: hypothetical protein ACYTHK_12310 [Planctomycetota bacterium]|jgi:hypothetical protein